MGFLHDHTHAADEARGEVLRTRANIKKRAQETQEPPQQILGQEMENLSQAASIQMVPLRFVRRTVRRVRQAITAPQPIPADRATLELPEEYRTLANGENFVLFDSGVGDSNRIIVFGTERSCSIISQGQHWFADGTFAIAPEIFFQLFTVHVLMNGQIIPCLYCLLPNKTQDTYRRLWTELKTIVPTGNPSSIMMDFEKAAINAVQDVYPNANIQGCLYHLSQNIYRKVQSLGLQEKYQTDAEFSLLMRMIPALAFVPIDEIINVFEELQEAMSPEGIPVLDYFEDSYIGRKRRRNRAVPLFPHEIWNVNERVVGNLPRTNNTVEGWNRKMQAAVSCHHPNIWRFINVLRKEYALNQNVIDQALGGHAPPPQKKNTRTAMREL